MDSTAWLDPKDWLEPQVTVNPVALATPGPRVRRERGGHHTEDSLASRGPREREGSKGVLGTLASRVCPALKGRPAPRTFPDCLENLACPDWMESKVTAVGQAPQGHQAPAPSRGTAVTPACPASPAALVTKETRGLPVPRDRMATLGSKEREETLGTTAVRGPPATAATPATTAAMGPKDREARRVVRAFLGA